MEPKGEPYNNNRRHSYGLLSSHSAQARAQYFACPVPLDSPKPPEKWAFSSPCFSSENQGLER